MNAQGRPGSFRFASRLERNIVRKAGRAVADHRMIEAGDRVLVAVSGGKDSLSMLRVLSLLRRRSPVAFELLAVTIHQGYASFSTERLEAHYRQEGIPFHIERVPINEILEAKLEPGVIPCSLCSRIRRGALYTVARRLGCHRIALGHHLDDLLETLLLNLFYSGKLRSMAPRYRSDDGDNCVIRPLCYVPEQWLARYAAESNFPVTTCATEGCDDPDSRRRQIKQLITGLDSQVHGLRGNMLRALQNVDAQHLLDPRILPGGPHNAPSSRIVAQNGEVWLEAEEDVT